MSEPLSLRSKVLREAERLTTGDRNNSYGPPHQDFSRTAGVLTALGFSHEDKDISAHHVAMILIAVKLSRLTWSPGKEDSWTDTAGYAACGFEAHELTHNREEHIGSSQDNHDGSQASREESASEDDRQAGSEVLDRLEDPGEGRDQTYPGKCDQCGELHACRTLAC